MFFLQLNLRNLCMVCRKQLFELLMMSPLEWIHYRQCRSAAGNIKTLITDNQMLLTILISFSAERRTRACTDCEAFSLTLTRDRGKPTMSAKHKFGLFRVSQANFRTMRASQYVVSRAVRKTTNSPFWRFLWQHQQPLLFGPFASVALGLFHSTL